MGFLLSATTVSKEVLAIIIEAQGMQKFELEGESLGTPIKIGNEGMLTTCRGYLET